MHNSVSSYATVLISCIIMIACSVGVSSAQIFSLSQEEKAWIEENPVIRVAGGTGSPPIEFVENGVSAGYSIDYLKLIANKVGLKFEFVEGNTWDQHIENIKNKKIDVMHNISITPERDQYLNFTEPYLNLPFVYFGRRGAAQIEDLADLENKKIGAINGWATTELYLNDYPHLDVMGYASLPDALYDLSAGSLDVVVVQLQVGNYLIRQNFISDLEVIGQKFIPSSYQEDLVRVGVRKDWPILRDIIEKGAAALSQEDVISITDKWLSAYDFNEDIGLTRQEQAWLSLNETIFVGADTDAAPIDFIDQTGKISGISGSFLEIIGQKLGVNFVWAQNITLDGGLESIKNGDIHMMSAVTHSPDRATYMNFTESYLSISNVIVATAGGPLYGNLSTLNNKRLAVVSGFAVNEFISRDFPSIELIEFPTITQALKAVSNNKVDAYVGSIPSVTRAVAAEGLFQIVVVGETPYQSDISFGINNNHPILHSILNKALGSLSAQEKAEISERWLAFSVEEVQNYDLVWQVVAVTFIVIAIILIWNNKLRSEINARIEAERKMKISQKEAEKANSAKSAFLANMSHEIRTPLNAIIGFSEVMSSGVYGEIKNERYKEYLHDISESGKHLATVINDILDISKIEAGKWTLNESDFNLNHCVDAALNMFKGLANDKNVHLNVETDDNFSSVRIYGDEHCIKRAIINLLSNAIKFTPKGGVVTTSIYGSASGEIIIDITDTGIGIPAERIEHVKNPFGQLNDDQHLNEEGTGLGLSIVNQLTILHGGELHIKSKLNQGTSVSILLPAERVLECTSSYLSKKAL